MRASRQALRIAVGTAIVALSASLGRAGVQQIIDAISESEFRFARSTSTVPMMPFGWATETYYPRTKFSPEHGSSPSATIAETTSEAGGIIPALVTRRDMLLLGGDVGWDYISVRSGPYSDQSVTRLAPVAAWLHQWNDDNLTGVFAAPIFSQNQLGDGDWGVSGYAGVIGMRWFSDELQLLYGGVCQDSFGRQTFYPYLGVLWLPNPQTSLSLIFPWPSVTYALNERWIVKTSLAPGGSSWVRRDGDYESTQSLSSWNWTAGVGYRLHGKLWLLAGAGVAGLRGLAITHSDQRARLESDPSPVFTLSLQFRP
jgi:hypothetical protein